LFADRGMRTRCRCVTRCRFSDVRYYATNFQFLQVHPDLGQMAAVLQRDHRLCVGARQDHRPAAVPQLLRRRPGQRARLSREPLGPRDNIGIGNPYGGNLRVVSRLELLFPVPEKWKSAARISWFYDMGNVFQTGNKVKFLGRTT
jgi:hypothetical protein